MTEEEKAQLAPVVHFLYCSNNSYDLVEFTSEQIERLEKALEKAGKDKIQTAELILKNVVANAVENYPLEKFMEEQPDGEWESIIKDGNTLGDVPSEMRLEVVKRKLKENENKDNGVR